MLKLSSITTLKLSMLIPWLGLLGFETASQVFMKLAAGQLQGVSMKSTSLGSMVTNLDFMASVGCDCACFLLWMGILQEMKLSLAYVMTSCAYITVLLAGWFISGEPVHALAGLGVCSILGGIYLIGQTESLPRDEA